MNAECLRVDLPDNHVIIEQTVTYSNIFWTSGLENIVRGIIFDAAIGKKKPADWDFEFILSQLTRYWINIHL